jgi:hypothetical protein
LHLTVAAWRRRKALNFSDVMSRARPLSGFGDSAFTLVANLFAENFAVQLLSSESILVCELLD